MIMIVIMMVIMMIMIVMIISAIVSFCLKLPGTLSPPHPPHDYHKQVYHSMQLSSCNMPMRHRQIGIVYLHPQAFSSLDTASEAQDGSWCCWCQAWRTRRGHCDHEEAALDEVHFSVGLFEILGLLLLDELMRLVVYGPSVLSWGVFSAWLHK